MNLTDLHSTKDFTGLFQDPRFIMLTLYLRSQRPNVGAGDAHQIIVDGGKLEGWLSCIEKMEGAAMPPGSITSNSRPIPYARSHPENNS